MMTGGTCQAAALAVERARPPISVVVSTTRFRITARGSACSTTLRLPFASCSATVGIRRAAIVDCDVHHGNGTAFVFERDSTVFTFSIHQQHNYPVFKPRSDLDIGLDDGAGDEEYVRRLESALPTVMASRPDLVVYLAGADPFRADRLGGLSLTFEGLRGRDRMVFDAARRGDAPVCVVLAGGYAADVQDTVDVHVGTIAELVAGRVE